jgi:hypothetical protein
MMKEANKVSGEEEIRKAGDAGCDEEENEQKVGDLPESTTDANPTSLTEQAFGEEAYGIGK